MFQVSFSLYQSLIDALQSYELRSQNRRDAWPHREVTPRICRFFLNGFSGSVIVRSFISLSSIVVASRDKKAIVSSFFCLVTRARVYWKDQISDILRIRFRHRVQQKIVTYALQNIGLEHIVLRTDTVPLCIFFVCFSITSMSSLSDPCSRYYVISNVSWNTFNS